MRTEQYITFGKVLTLYGIKIIAAIYTLNTHVQIEASQHTGILYVCIRAFVPPCAVEKTCLYHFLK